MNEKEIIDKFLNNAIKDINENIIAALDEDYKNGKGYDKEALDDLINQKRILECYL